MKTLADSEYYEQTQRSKKRKHQWKDDEWGDSNDYKHRKSKERNNQRQQSERKKKYND